MKLHEKICLTGFWEMKHADLQWISYEGMHQLHQQTTEVCNRIKKHDNIHLLILYLELKVLPFVYLPHLI